MKDILKGFKDNMTRKDIVTILCNYAPHDVDEDRIKKMGGNYYSAYRQKLESEPDRIRATQGGRLDDGNLERPVDAINIALIVLGEHDTYEGNRLKAESMVVNIAYQILDLLDLGSTKSLVFNSIKERNAIGKLLEIILLGRLAESKEEFSETYETFRGEVYSCFTWENGLVTRYINGYSLPLMEELRNKYLKNLWEMEEIKQFLED